MRLPWRKRVTSPAPVIAAGFSHADLASRHRRVPNGELSLLWELTEGQASIWASMNARAVASQEIKLVRRVRPGRATRMVGKRWRSKVESGQMGRKAAEFVNQGGEFEDVADHPILDLLNHPMKGVSGQAWIERLQFFKERTGNAFANVIVDGSTGLPMWLFHMQPQWTRIIPAESGDDPVAGYLFGQTSARQQPFKPEEVVHFTLRAGEDPLYADTWAQDVETELRILRANNAFHEEFIERGMVPPFALRSEDANDTQLTETRVEMERNYGGVFNWIRPLLLRKWDVVPLNAKPSEFQTIEQLEMVSRAVRSAAGVPESMADKDSTNASARTGYSSQYLGTTIAPRVERLADELTDQIIPLFGEDPREFCFIAGEVVPEDRDFGLRVAQTLVPWGLPLNRGLEGIGLDGIGPEGDKSNVTGPAPMNPFDAALGNVLGRSCSHGWDWKSVGWIRTKDDRIADNRVNDAVREIAGRLERDVGALYASIPASGNVPASFELELRKILDPALEELIRLGAGMAFRELDGDDAFQIEPKIPEGFTVDLARQISDTTRERLSEVIAAGARDGSTTAEVQARVAQTIDGLSGHAANTITRTETARAVESGRHAQWAELGVEQRRWRLAPNPCPMCIGFDRKFGGRRKVALDEPFAPAGTSFVGSDGKTYTLSRDVFYGGGVHPNCRCGTEAVLDD